jgi:hypothetical protein
METGRPSVGSALQHMPSRIVLLMPTGARRYRALFINSAPLGLISRKKEHPDRETLSKHQLILNWYLYRTYIHIYCTDVYSYHMLYGVSMNKMRRLGCCGRARAGRALTLNHRLNPNRTRRRSTGPPACLIYHSDSTYSILLCTQTWALSADPAWRTRGQLHRWRRQEAPQPVSREAV